MDTEKSITYPLRLPCRGWGRVWAHAFTFSLAACNICGRIFSIAWGEICRASKPGASGSGMLSFLINST